MTSPRETAYAALYARLSGMVGLKSSSRTYQSFDDTQARDQPFLCIAQDPEIVENTIGALSKVKLVAKIYIYCRADGVAATPGTQLNTLMDALTDTLKPDPWTGLQTLDGAVYNAALKGNMVPVEGVAGQQGGWITTVEMILTH